MYYPPGPIVYHYKLVALASALQGARTEMLRGNYNDPMAGHFGFGRTLELVTRKYYWPRMKKEIKAYVDVRNWVRGPSEYLRLSMTECPSPGFLGVFGSYADGVAGEY